MAKTCPIFLSTGGERAERPSHTSQRSAASAVAAKMVARIEDRAHPTLSLCVLVGGYYWAANSAPGGASRRPCRVLQHDQELRARLATSRSLLITPPPLACRDCATPHVATRSPARTSNRRRAGHRRNRAGGGHERHQVPACDIQRGRRHRRRPAGPGGSGGRSFCSICLFSLGVGMLSMT